MKRESATAPEAIDPAERETRQQAPLYALIAKVLRKAIRGRSIARGAVLLEGPVAELLHATRTPVRQAFRILENEGLVSRFEGRGYVAGPRGSEPSRIALTPAMLGIGENADPVRKTLGWEGIHDRVERDVVHLSVFGAHRLNEVELARHFDVGRLVAHDVLLRLERVGLVEKDDRQRWSVRPLDDARINHLYELRWLLEPAAIRAATEAQPEGRVASMIAVLRSAMRAYPAIAPADLDRLENDLHIETLSHCANDALLQSLERTRCVLTLSKHVLGVSAPMPRSDPFMAEHLAILEAVRDHAPALAADRMRHHLESSCVKVTRRVARVRRSREPPSVPYVDRR